MQLADYRRAVANSSEKKERLGDGEPNITDDIEPAEMSSEPPLLDIKPSESATAASNDVTTYGPLPESLHMDEEAVVKDVLAQLCSADDMTHRVELKLDRILSTLDDFLASLVANGSDSGSAD